MTGILIGMLSAGIITAVGEDILNSIGHSEHAKWLKVGGVSLTASLGLGLIVKLISQTKKAFGG
jgi:hypothetical protein